MVTSYRKLIGFSSSTLSTFSAYQVPNTSRGVASLDSELTGKEDFYKKLLKEKISYSKCIVAIFIVLQQMTCYLECFRQNFIKNSDFLQLLKSTLHVLLNKLFSIYTWQPEF